MHHLKERVAVEPLRSRDELRRQRIEDVGLLQLDTVQHRSQRRVRHPEEGVVRVAQVDETLPKLPAFSDRTESHRVTDDCDETLGSSDGRVEQLGVRQKAEVQIRVLLVSRRRLRRFRRRLVAGLPRSDGREEDGPELFALDVEDSFDGDAEQFSFPQLASDPLNLNKKE